jgi:Spy/CpxP family protein refolding chaperone
MKKYILAIAVLATLSVGDSFAQRARVYEKPGYNAPRGNDYETYHINKLDNVVKLNRKQENKIKKIENRYDKIMANSRSRNFKQLEWDKQKEIMSVLTPVQRQRWMAYQNNNKPGRFNGRG